MRAGRMQDNEPLMRALSNLITVNAPDLVLFVGEALVGNDAVDQLTKFNQRLSDLATDAATAHTIDGILLTKFDTIDDKVWRLPSYVSRPSWPAAGAFDRLEDDRTRVLSLQLALRIMTLALVPTMSSTMF